MAGAGVGKFPNHEVNSTEGSRGAFRPLRITACRIELNAGAGTRPPTLAQSTAARIGEKSLLRVDFFAASEEPREGFPELADVA